MRDLRSLTKQELLQFFGSFDQVLSDVDGVLWLSLEKIPGTPDGVKSLKNLGKKLVFVSNNSTKTLDFYHKQLTSAGFEVEKDEIITPIIAMISYLRKMNFCKEIFLIGMSSMRQELQNSGFKVAESVPQIIGEDVKEFTSHAIAPNETIGAVIADGDVNLNYLKLQRAATLLKDPEVIFIIGAADTKLPLGLNHVLLGPGYFHQILEDMSGRKPCFLAKPSPLFNEYLVERLNIEDPSRVLFIGDSVVEDMGFATTAGYKKLLVLSGLTKKDAVLDWKFPDELKPDFYVDSLKTVHELIEGLEC